MQQRPPHYAANDTSADTLSLSQLENLAQGWLLDGEYRQLSARTMDTRRDLIAKFLWFLRQRELPSCGLPEVRAFLAYLSRGHLDPDGRWGNPRMTAPLKPRSVQSYYVNLQALFSFVIAEEALAVSPFARLKPPIDRPDQVQPFTGPQVAALERAAKSSKYPQRDYALLLLLLDTGARASEVCALCYGDLDLQSHRATVEGKGGKSRSIFLGLRTTRALWDYLRSRQADLEPAQPLFLSAYSEALTRSGLLRIVHRWGLAAELDAARCSPHTFRHTFAIEFLRAGGSTFALQELLGHTSLTMVRRYVKMAEADLEAQHRQFSPADRIHKKDKR